MMTWMVILELLLIFPYLYFNMVILLLGQNTGYMVLHPDMIHKLKPGQDTSYCNALMSFLWTDVKEFISFQPFESLHDDIDNYINNLVHGEMTAMQLISFFYQILSIITNDSNEIFSFLEGKAREATIIPF